MPVGQRTEDVEQRAHAHLATDRRHHLHRRVVHRREHETDAAARDALGNLRRLQVDLRAQRLQDVRAAGLRGHAAVAVLGDLASRRGDHEHRGGGDVEGMRAIAAGADDVDQVGAIGDLDRQREFAQHGRRRGDLAHGFLLDPQAGEDGRGHHRRDFAAHDLPHQFDHLVEEDLAVFDRALQGILRGE
jgi:hypothetical protein